jgi:hypothetical protein
LETGNIPGASAVFAMPALRPQKRMPRAAALNPSL